MISTLLASLFLVLFSKASILKTLSNTICVSENGTCSTSVCVKCQSLRQFVNGTETIPNKSTIIFLPGNHSLNSSEGYEALVAFHNKTELTLKGLGNTSIVACSGKQSGFLFQNSSNVTITNLQFRNCGVSMSNHLFGGVFLNYSSNIYLSQVLIRDSKGYGLHISDYFGNITIKNSHFVGNKDGNVVIWFKHFECATSLSIHNSMFQDGFTSDPSQNATGLYLLILRQEVDVYLSDLIFKNNSGQTGGNIAIQLVDAGQHTSSVTIKDCHIEDGKAFESGGGMSLWFEKKSEKDADTNCTHKKPILTVVHTVFTNNTADRSAGGVLVTYYERPGIGCTVRQVEFTNCSFHHNHANRGSAIEITKHKIPIHQVHNVPQFSVVLKNCTVEHNYLTPKPEQLNEDGIVEIFSVEDFVVDSSSFSNNSGTALMLVNSGVQFRNEIVFNNNSARYGGAIKLCDSSVMYFNNDTRVKFLSNHADQAGGAIYAENQCLQEAPPCFFQMSLNTSVSPIIDELATNILLFDNNLAEIAGHAIYGGSVDNCFTDTQLQGTKNDTNSSFFESLKLYNQIFEFTNTSKISLVTSDPYGVCKCDKISHQPNCSDRTISMEGYAGESLTLYVSPVGQTNGSVPAQITVDTDLKGQQFTVKRLNGYNVSLIPFCQEMVLAVYPERDGANVSFKLSIVQINALSENSNYYQKPKMIVNITLQPCPFPFILSKTTKSCDCQQEITQKYHLTCHINNKTITVHNTKDADEYTWIGYVYTHNTTAIAASKQCRKSRCKEGTTTLNISNLNEICVEGRDGRVCGKCKSNYSLALGPLTCIPTEGNCSVWKFFLLLLAFFLAGILLICFLSFFNLTVTEGTISGLLFYANCIHANHKSIFFNNDGDSSNTFYIFISWLNLDFGFKICFYGGMTVYHKFWLEIGFLFYLLLLAILIVCLSRRSVLFTRLTGRNMVSVLSTLLLLAYPKLVRISIKVWKCHHDKYWSSDSSKPWIWHSDETIDCFSTWKHLILFIVSIVLFSIALLYMLCLLLIQCLQRGSGWFVLRWVNKLRPFFDANTGPCRDHYQFWPGILLFARLGLYIVFWPVKDPRQRSYVLLALCIFIFFLACVSPNGVYKKWPLNLLEFSFFLNLCITAGAVAEKHPFNYAFGYTSLAIAAFTFLLILIYHTYKKIRETRRWKRMVATIKERRVGRRRMNELEGANKSPSESSPLIRPGQGMPPVIQFTAPREPLLEDSD